MSPAPRLSKLLALALTALMSCPAKAEPRALRVRGGAKIADVSVWSDDNELVLRGTLEDELGQRIRAAALSVSVGETSTYAVSACAGGHRPQRAGDGYRISTDAEGGFCLRLEAAVTGMTARIAYAGDDYHDGARTSVGLTPRRAQLRLAFDWPVIDVPLEKPIVEVGVSAHADAGAPFGAPVRVVILHRKEGPEPTHELGTVEIAAGSRGRFGLRTKDLGGPGPGALIARHSGSAATDAVEAIAVIRRTAAVTLSVARMPGEVPAGEEVELQFGATSDAGAVPNGWLEAELDGRPVGAAEVSKGLALLRVRLETRRPGNVELTIRYIPKEPWWVPGDSLSVLLPVAQASAWSRLPWLLAVSAIAYFIIRAWRRPGRVRKGAPQSRVPAGRPEVALVEKGSADSGWSGLVVDAHEGEPIRGARVQILLPTFQGDGVSGTAMVDDRGSFELGRLRAEHTEGARIEVTAPNHSRITRPLPAPGRVVISMVARRRAVLDYLVSWARSRGLPWGSATDPTPGDVAAVARDQKEPSTIAWAHAVEEAAFGAVPPDEPREEELKRREPRSQQGSERKKDGR